MMNCTEFHCYSLRTWDDSLLYSTSKHSYECPKVAEATFMTDTGEEYYIKIIPYGEIMLTYRGETYTDPEDYPEELVDLIKSHNGNWSEWNDGDEDLEVNNWNYYAYVINNEYLTMSDYQYFKNCTIDEIYNELYRVCSIYADLTGGEQNSVDNDLII